MITYSTLKSLNKRLPNNKDSITPILAQVALKEVNDEILSFETCLENIYVHRQPMKVNRDTNIIYIKIDKNVFPKTIKIGNVVATKLIVMINNLEIFNLMLSREIL